jgi:hypothetical protein
MMMHTQYVFILCILTTIQTFPEAHKDFFATTIYAPQPLAQIHFDTSTKIIRSCIYTTKNMSPLLALVFFASMTQTSFYQDCIDYPFVIGLTYYGAISTYLSLQTLKKNRVLYLAIKKNLQEIFNLLIIGYGIHNEITSNYYFSLPLKSSLPSLQHFLNQAYDSWLTLSDFYHQHYQNESVFIYQIKNIDFIDVLQATQNEIAILPVIINFYQEPYDFYDLEIIVTYLETKLQTINRNVSILDFHS